MADHGRAVKLDYRPRASLDAQIDAQALRRATLDVLDGDRQEWEVRIMGGLLYFGLCGQPESERARESRTRDRATYARHLRAWFALVDRWVAVCEQLYTAGYPHAIEPPDLPLLIAPYCGD